MSDVMCATKLTTSSWNCSENLLLRWTPSLDVVAKCSIMALIMSSRKNHPAWSAASRAGPWEMLHCRASCSWTSLAEARVEAEDDVEEVVVLSASETAKTRRGNDVT